VTRRLRNRPAGEAGFTLIELVVTIVIMGIIFVPLADFFIQYLTTYNQTQQRLSDSHDLQIVAAYFSQDVANTGLRNQASGQTIFAPQQSVWTSASGFPSTFCGAPINAASVLLVKWDDASNGSDTINSVDYYMATEVTGGPGQPAATLHRVSCREPSLGPPTLTPDTTLVHNLSATPAVSCSSTCTAAVPPTAITLTLSVQSGATDTSGTSVTLTGQRRQSSS
jgi:prepilin-type N-terminal cleavage/methylation domain-containing protein